MTALRRAEPVITKYDLDVFRVGRLEMGARFTDSATRLTRTTWRRSRFNGGAPVRWMSQWQLRLRPRTGRRLYSPRHVPYSDFAQMGARAARMRVTMRRVESTPCLTATLTRAVHERVDKPATSRSGVGGSPRLGSAG